MRDNRAKSLRGFQAGGSILLLVCACAGMTARPAWIERPESLYPQSRYISGLGGGQSLESASANAVAAISQTLHSRVEQIITDRQASESDGQESREHQSIRVETRLSTEGAVEGVRVAESWRDQSGLHYALAVLDRAAASERLAGRLRGVEQAIERAVRRSSSAATALERAQELTRAAGTARDRELLAARYRVVSGDDWRPSLSTAELEARARRALADVLFAVEAQLLEGNTSRPSVLPSLQTALAASISDAGFRVDPAAGANAHVSCLVKLSPPFERGKSGWTHYLWEASVAFSDNRPGAPALFVHEDSGSASHPEPALARAMALEQAQKRVVPELREGLRKFLTGDSQPGRASPD